MWTELAHNQLVFSSIGMSLLEALTGYPPVLISATEDPVPYWGPVGRAPPKSLGEGPSESLQGQAGPPQRSSVNACRVQETLTEVCGIS